MYYIFTGSFTVVNSDTMEEVISLHHRKEEIADIKFSPSKLTYIYTNLPFLSMLCHTRLFLSTCILI